MKNNIRIATINLWGLEIWEERRSNLFELVKKYSPDILFAQEVQYEQEKQDGYDQTKEIKNACGYEYYYFLKVTVKTKKKEKKFRAPRIHGIAVFSKTPIINIIPHVLNSAGDEKEERAVLFFQTEFNGKVLNAVNVHFDNSDSGAAMQFRETLELVKNKKEQTIIAGDFNIFSLDLNDFEINHSYDSSFDKLKYISYPEDEDTLDYVLIPKNFSFEKIECLDDFVSDHRMVVSDILLD